MERHQNAVQATTQYQTLAILKIMSPFILDPNKLTEAGARREIIDNVK
jgi:hypothetical protein